MSTATVADRSRVPAGVRAGGQFAVESHAEADVHLDAASEPEALDRTPAPVYRVPSWGVQIAEEKIAAANKRLARAGIEQRFTYEWSEPYVETTGEYPSQVKHEYRTLTVSHPAIAYDGWEFVAALDQAGEGTLIVRTRPGADLQGWAPSEALCEHCHQRRHRNTTYVLRNADGELRQVGSNCLENFLGVKPSGLWAIGEDPLGGFDERADWFGGARASTVADPREIIAAALFASDEGRHYEPKSAEQFGRVPTARHVDRLLFTSPRTSEDRAERERYAEATARFEREGTIDDVLATVAAMEPGTDYVNNLHKLAAMEWVDARHAGMLASAVSGWAREKGRRVEREKTAGLYRPGFIAAEGEKIPQLHATVTKVRYIDDPYSYYGGVNTLVLMRDENGHTVKWFASGRHDLNDGDQIALTGGRVKKHDVYEGQDQTVVTRVKYEVLNADDSPPADPAA